MTNLRWLAAAWLLLPVAFAAETAYGFDHVVLQSLLAEFREERDLPGLRAAVRFSDGRIVTAAVGFADLQTNEPLDDQDPMPGGSTGKTFVAALTMLLVEDGKLNLDDPVGKWVGSEPWYSRLPNADAVLVRHLLSHSSGLGDYPGSIRFKATMVWRALRTGSAYFSPEELIDYGTSRNESFTPGQGYQYSDAGYLVLGRVIEAAAGRDYYQLLGQRILKPRGLGGVDVADRSVLSGITNGYIRGTSVLRDDGRMKLDPASEWTGGGLTLNPTMLVKFYADLAEGRIVDPQSFEKMRAGGWRDPTQPDWHYGFGMFVAADAISHGGRWSGYRSRVAWYSEPRVAIAAQSNTGDDADLPALVAQIAELAR